MLRLICGSDRLQNTAELIGRICDAAREETCGQILIVPEQYSHETERTLCAVGGDSISRYAEVLSFSRLASRVFSLYGGVCEEYLDKGGRFISMYLAVSRVREQLKYYAAICTKAEFLQRLCAAVEEFMSYGLLPEALREAAGRLEGSFAQKLTELSLIYESYLAVCKTGRSDPVTRLTRLEALLRQTDFAADKTIFIDGFSDFTAVELQIVTALMKHAKSVTVALCAGGAGSAFETANDTAKTLRRIAARWNILAEVQSPQCAPQRDETLSAWLAGLFAPRFAVNDAQTQALRLHTATSAEREARYAAWRVQQIVQNGGRYREVCIALSDEVRYEPHLRRIFARAGIPAYFAGNADILKKPLFSALLAALEAIERFDADAVLRYLKSALSPLGHDACDRLERYVYMWNIRGSLWCEEWTMHPKGYGIAWDEGSRQTLSQLNAWRESGLAPLYALRERWRAAENVEQMLAALDDFCEQTQMRPMLAEMTAQLEGEGRLQQAQELRQLHEILMQAMEQMAMILGACRMQGEEFTQVFRMLLSQYSVGTIPATVDEVQIGALPAFRHKCAPHLIVLGAEEGSFPSFEPTNGIFSQSERETLIAMQLPLSPEQERRLTRELGWVYASLSAATASCALSCSGDQPSFLYLRTCEMFPRLLMTSDRDVAFSADVSERAAARLRGGYIPPSGASDETAALYARATYDFMPLAAPCVHALYGKSIGLSASKIDRFAGCRFSFFMCYGLDAQPWKQARFDAPIFGTFVHSVLEKTVDEVQKNGGFAVVSDDALRKIALRHAQDYTREFLPDLEKRGERFGYLFARNMDEVLSVVSEVGDELRNCAFVPQSVELKFAKDGTLPPIYVQGARGSGVLSGLVDRVDLYETGGGAYYRVVDYKTGSKDFDYADILCGQGMQMLIYLFALREYGRSYYGKALWPAGVLYVPARTPMERVEGENVDESLQKKRDEHRRRKGLVLDDDGVLAAMEPFETQPRYLPLKITKSGKSGDLASREQLALLERFVLKTLRQQTDEILSGVLTPNPIDRGQRSGACLYCDYKQTCHRDSCRHDVRPVAKVKSEEFWKEVERRCQDGEG